MNLSCTIWIWAGGEGSGCHGPNCGRPTITVVKLQDGNSATGKPDGFHITDEHGKKIGSVLSHREGNTVFIDWISGKLTGSGFFSHLGNLGIVRAIVSELKKQYPGTSAVTGNRTTGIHQRVGTQNTAVAWS